MAFDEIYTDGTDAVRKLWQVGDEYSFTVVATADETDTNSFSLFGGDAPSDLTVVTDLTDAPTDLANTNDDVLIGENPFPDDHTCPEEGTSSDPAPPPNSGAATVLPAAMVGLSAALAHAL